MLPPGTLDALVAESTNSEERWAAEEDEIAAFVQYHTKRASRLQIGSLYVDPHAKALREGSDTPLATHLEFLMRRHHVVPSLTTVADTLQLDLHWAAALRWMQFAREVVCVPGSYPLMEMYDRTVRLMTAPRSSFSSRPWLMALQLVDEALHTGNKPTPTLMAGALDALSHSATSVQYRPQGQLTTRHKALLWHHALQVLQRVQSEVPRLAGEEGAAVAESAVRLLAVSGRWDVAVGILSSMDLAAKTMTSRLLVPTPATLVEAMCGCLTAGLTAYGTALMDLLLAHYQWKQVPNESVVQLLQVCRRLDPQEGLVQRIVKEVLQAGTAPSAAAGAAGDEGRQCCLRSVKWHCVFAADREASPADVGSTCVTLGDCPTVSGCVRCEHLAGSLWPAGELSSLCYAVRRFAKVYDAAVVRGNVGALASSVIWSLLSRVGVVAPLRGAPPAVRRYVGGGDQILQRLLHHIAYLPIPLRQCKRSLLHALVGKEWQSQRGLCWNHCFDQVRRCHGRTWGTSRHWTRLWQPLRLQPSHWRKMHCSSLVRVHWRTAVEHCIPRHCS